MIKMRETSHSEQVPRFCPACGRKLDKHRLVVGEIDEPPADGDLSICIGCGAGLRFCNSVACGLVVLRDEEIEQEGPEMKRVLLITRKIIEENKK